MSNNRLLLSTLSKSLSILLTIFILNCFINLTFAQYLDKTPRNHIYELIEKAETLVDEQDIDSAIAIIGEALESAKTNLGQKDTTTIQVYHKLGLYLYFNAAYDSAESIWQKTLQLRIAVFGEKHPDVALTLSNLGIIYYELDEYERSKEYHQAALSLRRELFGSAHEDVAASLNNLGNLYCAQSDYSLAEPLFVECLEIRRSILEPDDPNIAITLNNLAILYADMGRFAEAKVLYEETLKAFETSLGSEHPYTATCRNNLAVFYQDLGEYNKSERLHKQALQTRIDQLGSDHPEVAHSMNNLAAVYWSQGKSDEAESLYIEAMSIWREVYGAHSPDLARSMTNLADLYRDRGEYRKADSLLNKALQIRLSQLGDDHPDVALSYLKLAALSLKQGLFQTSANYADKALTIITAAFGKNHPERARCLYNIAQAQTAIGNFKASINNLNEALRTYIELFGHEHPMVASVYYQLALAYAHRNVPDSAVAYYIKFRRTREKFIEYAFSSVSEDQKLKYIQDYPIIDHSLLSYALTDPSGKSQSEAFEMILKGKALIVEVVSAERRYAYQSYDSTVIGNIRTYNNLNSEIANLAIAGVENLEPDMYQSRIRFLYRNKDSLEALISENCQEFREDLAYKRFTIEDIASQIASDQLLIEFFRYSPYDFANPGINITQPQAERYLAFTFTSGSNIAMHDLGPVNIIDSLITEVRKEISSSAAKLYSEYRIELENRLKKPLNELYQTLIKPLIGEFPGIKSFLISPNGQLNLLPFEILTNANGEYLLENYQISYISSGRELLQFSPERSRLKMVMILASPDYDCYQSDEPVAGNLVHDVSEQLNLAVGPVRGGDNCLSSKFSRLSYTEKEKNTIIRVLENDPAIHIESFTGAQATEGLLKNMKVAPDVLHLSTHGFFCENRDNFYDNPLSRGGLAFAGANCIFADHKLANVEDGILTALEVTGIDLNGTDLVVLSACETGVGDIENSEGVYGLRRAFQLAGAGTIIMSLWSVPDKETFEIMETFYGHILDGSTKSEALRQASLEVLRKHRNRYNSGHPYFWGGFILSGNPY